MINGYHIVAFLFGILLKSYCCIIIINGCSSCLLLVVGSVVAIVSVWIKLAGILSSNFCHVHFMSMYCCIELWL